VQRGPLLDEAIEDGLHRAQLGTRTTDAGARTQAARPFLEMDELVALIDAAGEQDASAPVIPARHVRIARRKHTRACR
jgi:hypothetical protein